MSLILFGIFLFLSFLIASFVWESKEKSFLSKEEVNRCINNNSWSPNGRVYTEGFVVIKDDSNEAKFIKQTKLCDIGILD